MAAEEESWADSGFGAWTGRPWPQVTDSMFFIWSPISATLRSLFSIRKRNARVRKVEAVRERERAINTQHTQRGRKEENRNTEDKMAFIRTAAEGQRSLIFPSFGVSLHFEPPFISPARHMVAQRTFKSHKRCLHMLHKSL